jgi:hypothetical protein
MSALERYQPPRSLGEIERLAGHFAKSGLFGGNPSQIIVKMLAGAENGIPPFAAVQGIDIIQGRPVVGADLLARAVKESGRYDFRVRVLSDEECRIEFFQGGDSIGVSTFTRDDAKKAGLASKDNYQKFGRNMLYARAMSNGVRWFCPDAVSSKVYVDGEIPAPPAEVNGDDTVIHEITVDRGQDVDTGEEMIRVTSWTDRVPEQPVEPSPGGRTPHEIVAEGLGALAPELRKRLKWHLDERLRLVSGDKRVKETWLDAIVDNFPGDYQGAPLYEQLPALLEALEEQYREQMTKREPDATPLERRDALDARSDAEAEGLFDRHAPSAQGALTPRMYDADTAPS